MSSNLLQIVQHGDHRCAAPQPALDDFDKIGGGRLIHGRERLIEQDDRRVLQQDAGEQHALELTDG